ncbi:Gfo/Idh/MocA family protein [Marinococcus luteus]|uniref:Gfo/Idh/MocA family protein n=1 Tax=Marinococcus luteus TaxID=1122204 RepID=UPI002ACCD44B|nr:Gfo/Idh/MocA family oxidoreductase [Marinococcus luteus]MDZ5784436.1 Gfo/Idh/MocA family oxidoreductase [Marinococcus luteus]
MKTIRWGILGTADIARRKVLPALQHTENAEAYAIASGSGKAGELAEAFNIPNVYQSYDALLEDPDIDAVYIPLPNHLHKEWSIKAAEKQKHILCEKPAALTQAEAEEIKNACEEHGVQFMEAFMYRFHPQHQLVQKMLAGNAIGDVVTMRSSFTFPLQRTEGNIRLHSQADGGGSLYDVGCYCIHAIRQVMGEPEQAKAFYSFHENVRSDWAAAGILTFPDGRLAHFDSGMNAALRNDYEVVGTKGVLRAHQAFVPTEQPCKVSIELANGESYSETISDNYYITGMQSLSLGLLEGRSWPSDGLAENASVLEQLINS